jgi:low temperature requirement protein LtrA
MSVNRLKLSANPLVPRHPRNGNSFPDIENIRASSGYKTGSLPEGGYHEPQDWSDNEDKPEFQRHKETTNIELFYDLFFVANLTSFGSVHEINSKQTLTSYIGFFCVLWFTWCQVSMFDVRYVVDSLLERVAKACHLGIMVGFAVVGPNFDTLEEGPNTFRSMALILMVSRLVLSSQYLLILWHVRHYRNTSLPLALIAGANFAAAIIYLGVSLWVFSQIMVGLLADGALTALL